MSKTIAIVSAAILGIGAAWVVAQETLPAAGGTQPAAKPTIEDQYSYAIGLDMGTRFRLQETGVDLDNLLAGLKDGLEGSKPRFDQETCGRAIQHLGMLMQRKEQQAMSENAKQGEAFLEANKAKEGVKVTPSGLQYKVIEAGTGPTPGPTDTVKCNYRGTLVDGTEFDASANHGGPASFPVNRVIPGWTEALQMMKVGDKWQLFIPAKLAYGNTPPSPTIQAGSTLIFDIELLGIE